MQRAPPTRRSAFILVLFVAAALLASNQVRAQSQGQITGIGPWTEQTDYGASSGNTGSGGVPILGESCVTYSGYIYCVGGQNIMNVTSPNTSDVFYAPVSPSGTVGAWTETTDYGATSGTSGNGGLGVGWPSCVQYGGYIYCFGGSASSGVVSKVYYAQLSSSGVGPWTETTDYGASSGTLGSGGVPAFQLACVVDSGYVYCTGSGFGTSKVFYAQLSPSGVGPWVETTDYGATSGKTGSGGIAIGSNACADSSGYIWCVGGTVSGKPVSDVFYAPVNSSGVGAWTETTDYGAASGSSGTGGVPVYGTSCVSWSGYIICVAGDTTAGNPINTVAYAKDPTGDPVELVWVVPPHGYTWEGYWNFCEVSGSPTSAFALCYGGGASHGASAPIQTSSSTTTSSSTSTTTSTSSTAPLKVTPTLFTVLNPSATITAGGQAYDSAGFSVYQPSGGEVQYYRYSGPNCTGTKTALGDPVSVSKTAGAEYATVPNSPYTTFPSPGTYSYSASYGGDENDNPADSACETLTVTSTTASSTGGNSTTLYAIGGAAIIVVIGAGIYVMSRGRGKEEPTTPAVVQPVKISIDRSNSVVFGTDKAEWGRIGSDSGLFVPVTNMWSAPARLTIRATLKSGSMVHVLTGSATIAGGEGRTVFLQNFGPPMVSGTYSATFQAFDENNLPVSAPTISVFITVI